MVPLMYDESRIATNYRWITLINSMQVALHTTCGSNRSGMRWKLAGCVLTVWVVPNRECLLPVHILLLVPAAVEMLQPLPQKEQKLAREMGSSPYSHVDRTRPLPGAVMLAKMTRRGSHAAICLLGIVGAITDDDSLEAKASTDMPHADPQDTGLIRGIRKDQGGRN